MRSFLELFVAVVVFAGCATAPTVKSEPVAPAPAPPPPVIAECPKSLPTLATSGSAFGLTIDKVCLVGASEDAYLRLHEAVAPREGQALDADAVRMDIEMLFTQELKDVVVVAQPLDSKRVMLSYFVTEYPYLSDVKVEGVTALKPEEVRDIVHSGVRANPQLVKKTDVKLKQEYVEAGYPNATVKAVLEDTVLRIAVTEGPRATVKVVKFEGVKKLAEARLKGPLKLTKGAIFTDELVQLDSMNLTSTYYDFGFVDVRIENSTKMDDGGAVELTWKVTEGEAFKIGKLSFKGLAFSDEKTVMKSFETKSKAVFSRAMMKRDIGRIEELAKRAGTPVEVTPLTSVDREKHTIDVTFELESQKPATLKF